LELIFNDLSISTHQDSSQEYEKYIIKTLTNPEEAWRHPYNTQIDNASRLLIDIVVLHNNRITEEELQKIFFKAKKYYRIQNQGNILFDFSSTIKQVCRSFVRRNIGKDGTIIYTPFNPSISDFIIFKYLNAPYDYAEFLDVIDSDKAIQFLASAIIHDEKKVAYIANTLIDKLINSYIFFEKSLSYIITLSRLISNDKFTSIFTSNIHTIFNKILASTKFDYEDLIIFFNIFINNIKLSDNEFRPILFHILDMAEKYEDIEKLSEFMKENELDFIPKFTEKFAKSLERIFRNGYIETIIRENISDVSEEEHEENEDGDHSSYFTVNEDELCRLIAESTNKLIRGLTKTDISLMLSDIELGDIAAEEQHGSYFSKEDYPNKSTELISIDALFSTLVEEKYC
jgi:hypothetical protein